MAATSASPVIHELRQRLRNWGRPVGSNCGADLMAGLGQGQVSEWIELRPGSGAGELALGLVRGGFPRTTGRWLVVDGESELAATGISRLGIDLSRVLFVAPRDVADGLWVLEQGLRSRGVDVVVGRIERLPSVAARRLKLAAEAGNSRCVLLRGAEALRETSWADLRVAVTPLPSPSWERRRLSGQVLKMRQGLPGGTFVWEINHETNAVCLVSELADSASASRAAGA